MGVGAKVVAVNGPLASQRERQSHEKPRHQYRSSQVSGARKLALSCLCCCCLCRAELITSACI